MNNIFANNIFDGAGRILHNCIVSWDDQGRFNEIKEVNQVPIGMKQYDGWIIPGMINTHCHLELSHMQGSLSTGTGLIPFIKGIVTTREADFDTIRQAIMEADQAMYHNGVDAVGDICNTAHTFEAKAQSNIYYHNFIEVFDLMQSDDLHASLNRGLDVLAESKNPASVVPHAPYSCSPELLALIEALPMHQSSMISIHNQETVHETDFFEKKSGALIDFYSDLGLDLAHVPRYQQRSLEYYLQHAPKKRKHLFVHNTETTRDDILAAQGQLQECFWATCASANLYIENRLPDYQTFVDTQAKMTIGTDSLASNWSLSVWDEMKTIKKYNNYLPTETLLTWACDHGAQALGISDRYGLIAEGFSSGLVHIDENVGLDHLLNTKSAPKRVK